MLDQISTYNLVLSESDHGVLNEMIQKQLNDRLKESFKESPSVSKSLLTVLRANFDDLQGDGRE